jgi:DNA repair exonuclease SbcCD ATPase subunit
MRVFIAIVVVAAALAPSPAFAQTAPPAQRDVLAELLIEVRGLRQAMERAATVGARIQLLVARVQLQEQRIAESSRRLVAVRDELSKLDTQSAGVIMNVKSFDRNAGSLPPEEREQMQQMVEHWKTQVATFEKRRQDLANEESMLLQQVSADQGRWSDVNAQLDDIERSLATPPKK